MAARTDTPLLEIVIVNSTGGRDVLRACLESLQRHPLEAGEMLVWVVDSASTDGVVEMVRRESPWVRLEPLSYNAGFCVANNVALRRAAAPYVLVLNPDTEVSEG